MKGQFRVNYDASRARYRVEGKINGTRIRHFFESKTLADGFASIKNKELKAFGHAHANLSSSLRAEASWCNEKLAAIGASLRAAVEYYLAHHDKRSKSVTVKEACERSRFWIKARMDGNEIGEHQYRGIVRISRELEAIFGERHICDISSLDLSNWLDSMEVATSSKNSYRLSASSLFSFAREQGWIDSNPVHEVKAKRDRVTETRLPGIFEVEQAARLLEVAPGDILPYVAIGLFAGLRPTETLRLDWAQIDWQKREIEVRADICKTGRRRFVKMSDNLLEWLAPYRQTSGLIYSGSQRDMCSALTLARKAAGIAKWPKDGLRHSFCSYHLALHENATGTAHQAGHSVAIMHKHYDNRRRQSQGAAWFDIRPAASENVLAMPAA